MAKNSVTIQQRSVYHKYTEIEVELPENIKEEDVSDYLMSIEDSWVDVLDNLINQTEIVFGSGVHDHEGMNEPESDSEWRFQLPNGYGGHL